MPSVNSYSLSIRIYSDGFSFSVLEKDELLVRIQKQVTTPHETANRLHEELQNQHLYEAEFKAIEVIVYNAAFTLVPRTLFRTEDAASWLQLNPTAHTADGDIYTDDLEAFGCTNVYVMPMAISAFLKTLTPAIKVQHGISKLLQQDVQQAQLHTGIFMFPTQQDIFAVALSDNKLLLANSYNYQTPEDAVYYIMNIYKQLDLSITNVKCYINTTETGAEIKKALKQYIDVC